MRVHSLPNYLCVRAVLRYESAPICLIRRVTQFHSPGETWENCRPHTCLTDLHAARRRVPPTETRRKRFKLPTSRTSFAISVRLFPTAFSAARTRADMRHAETYSEPSRHPSDRGRLRGFGMQFRSRYTAPFLPLLFLARSTFPPVSPFGECARPMPRVVVLRRADDLHGCFSAVARGPAEQTERRGRLISGPNSFLRRILLRLRWERREDWNPLAP